MDGIIALLLSKKFTKDTVIGMGAIKGAACQVQSINKVGKTTTITLKWEDNVGGVHTQAFDIEDGLDGVSVSNATIKPDGHLELTLSNGNSIDCGQVLPQYDTMPTPSSSNEGQILQYIGTTTSNYTNGYFYECINDGGVYKWVEKSVQDSYTKGQIGSLSDLPDTSKNVIENIADIKLSVDQLSASKLSISDIDNALSDVSENPVQNKVIKLTLDQLRGSILDKLNEKEDKFRYSTMPTASVDYLNKIVEYIGATDSTYTNGYFYQCRFDGTNYSWFQKNIQPSSGGTGGDGVVDGYYNSADHLFYEENTFINPITGDDNTLYVSLDTNLLYRYNGLIFIRVDENSSGEDDIINGYYNTTDGKFYEDSTYTTEIVGQIGKIYISIDTNIQYRWDNISIPNKFVAMSIKVDDTLSDTSENPVQNKVIKVELDKLSASMLSASMKEKVINLEPIYLIGSGLNLDETTGELTASGIDVPIDDHLSDTSINPVQNKVITVPLQALQGSVLNKIQKRLSAQEDNFAIWDNQGEIKDSGISKDVIPITASTSNKLLVASDLSIKADKVSGAVDNDIALLDSTGNLKDSNKKLSDLQDKLTEGDGIDIDANNKISVNISYLTASRVGYIPNAEKGAVNGVAELDSTGKVPSSQLPSNELNDLSDVVITSPVNKQILAYNSTSGKWENQTGQETIGGVVIKGSILFANLPTTGMSNGDAYDIKDAFVTDNRFEEGSGIECGAGTDVVWIADENKWNILTPSGVYSFNGRTGAVSPATSDYDAEQIDYDNSTSGLTATNVKGAIDENVSNLSSHTSNISNPHSVTKSQVGLGNVINTGDSDTPVNGGTTKFTTGGAYTELNKKADKVVSATNGHLAGLDSNGNLTDSGKKASDFATDNQTFTQSSTRANITSGESFSTIFGKIMKWFADLKDLAFINKPNSGQTTTWLRGDGTWVAPPNTTYGVVSKTANGLAPQLPNETTTTKYLRQDGTWAVPPNNNTIPSAYCDTAAATAAKTASCTGYNLTSNSYLHVIIVNANTAASALTLNVNGKGAKPIYINGSASSSSNYTLPAGSYIVFYNGTNYYFRTDGTLTTKGVYNINPSYGSYNINSQMPTTRRLTKVVSAGSDGVGVWDDTTSESGWWQSDYFKFPTSANSKNIDISFKFDPEYGQNEVVALTGYILDTSTGKLCLRFGGAVTNAQLIAVDITYTPTYS